MNKQAWHFTRNTLRDGSPIPSVGETLHHDGPLIMCKSGLHASYDVLDALAYAPGSFVHRVRVGGEIFEDPDKLVCCERTIVWSFDATEVLREFARKCALDVIHLWDAPAVVVRYLRMGGEALRVAAGAAACATYNVAGAAGMDAAWAAAHNVAGAAGRDAAWAAAHNAAKAAGSAARAAAHNAAWAAGSAAGRAAQDAASAAAWDAARAKQSSRLVRMLNAARKKITKATLRADA